MFRLSIALLLVVSASAYADAPEMAWWVNASFDLTCKANPSRAIEFEGACFVIVEERDLRSIARYSVEDMRSVGAKLTLQAAYSDHKRLANKYYAVSVFEDANGKKGRAVLVSNDAPFRNIIRVERRTGNSEFSALIRRDNLIVWTFCLFCGDFEVIDKIEDNLQEDK